MTSPKDTVSGRLKAVIGPKLVDITDTDEEISAVLLRAYGVTLAELPKEPKPK